jgi:predicted O-linked N-acetylglucosamine transferase (SPINDLY family)
MVPQSVLDAAPPARATFPTPANQASPDLTETVADRAFDAVRAALATFSEEGSDDALTALRNACLTASGLVARMSRRQAQGPVAMAATRLAGEAVASGALDEPIGPDELARVLAPAVPGWPRILAAMLLTSAWNWPDAPRLDEVPSWLWEDYTRWLFAPPHGFDAPGQAEAYAAYYLQRLEELAHLAAVNRGSLAVRAALSAYLKASNCVPLFLSTGSLRRHFQLRGQILRAATSVGTAEEMWPQPRDGRRLRVGFVRRAFGANAEMTATLPLFEQLDPDRFEVILFAESETRTPIEDYARGRAADFRLLPTGGDAPAQALRDAALDVVVFATDLTATFSAATQLALQRTAPLQIVTNASAATTGFPEIDLYVSGTRTEAPEAAAQFTERLALLAGPGHAFNFEADKQEPTTNWTRSALGLPDDAIVFVSATDLLKITPEMQCLWTRLLAAVPNSHLLVNPIIPSDAPPSLVNRFCASFDRNLKASGIDDSRLHVAPLDSVSRSDQKSLIAVGDVFLGTYPVDDVGTITIPLDLGMPLVVREGVASRSRRCAGLLRSIGFEEFIAADDEGYLQQSVRLATDSHLRVDLRGRLEKTMNRMPQFMDTLAASEAFGEIMLRAYDEIAANGREAFRKETRPLMADAVDDPAAVLATSRSLLEIGMTDDAKMQVSLVLAAQPASVPGRQMMARILLLRGNLSRATEYLLAAVQDGSAPAEVWRDLAGALQQGGNGPGAINALQTAIRVNPGDAESWFMLGDIASRCGHADILRGVNSILEKLAPDDPRLGPLLEAARNLGPAPVETR